MTILFILLSAAQYNLELDWAEAGAKVIVRHCPICVQGSIVGPGRAGAKQARDEHHDWIGIRRGLCSRCGKTFTILPPFSPPYGPPPSTAARSPASGYHSTTSEHRRTEKVRKDWPVNRQACTDHRQYPCVIHLVPAFDCPAKITRDELLYQTRR